MILWIIIATLVVPPIGSGVALFVKTDAQCRKEHKATRMTGVMLDVYCED